MSPKRMVSSFFMARIGCSSVKLKDWYSQEKSTSDGKSPRFSVSVFLKLFSLHLKQFSFGSSAKDAAPQAYDCTAVRSSRSSRSRPRP